MRHAVFGMILAAITTSTAQACPGTEAARLTAPSDKEITAGFGMRFHPVLQNTRMHTGIDYPATLGDPVRAAGAGEVTAVGTDGPLGKHMIVDHGGGIKSLYARLSAIELTPRHCVGQGEVVGLAGSTGLSASVHLHFEVVQNGSVVDPLSSFTP